MKFQSYRATDPETSRQPFNRDSLQMVALRAVAAHPEGICAGDIGKFTGRDGIWKRLVELELKGFLVRGEPVDYNETHYKQRKCTITALGLKILRETRPIAERQLALEV